jgi:prevent-host-death family protein
MTSFKLLPAIELGEATGPLSDYVESAKSEPLVITSGGRPVAVIAAVKGLDLEQLSLGSDEAFLAFLSAARSQPEAGTTVSLEPLRAALDNDAREPSSRRSRKAS